MSAVSGLALPGGVVSRLVDVPGGPPALLAGHVEDPGPSGLQGPRADLLPFMKQILVEQGLVALWEASQALPTAKPQPPDVLAFLKKRFLAHATAALHGMGDALTSEPDRVEELARTG